MSEKIANPMGLDGFEFVEFTSLEPEKLMAKFLALGFVKVAKHRNKQVWLFRQGEINFILNGEPNSHAEQFALAHGDSACAMGFRVNDAQFALQRALALGAEEVESEANEDELLIPGIKGIGGSLIYFIDRYQQEMIYDYDFDWLEGVERNPVGSGLTYIDHLTHNLYRGQMDQWAEYYRKLFNFREIRFFDIEGEHTGLVSRAMCSPCNKIRIPLNEGKDDLSQIEEFMVDFKGEGIQHIALGTNNIYNTVETLRKKQIDFMDVPDVYYELLEKRLPNHGEDRQRLNKNYILVDGDTAIVPSKLLLQIFTKPMLGPVFFEIIQRKGDEGFGEGNFKALFESIERDQIRRGYIPTTRGE